MSFTRGTWIGKEDRGVYLDDAEEFYPVFETGCGCCTNALLSPEDADLIAAAGTSATRAEEMGYDGQAAVEVLPELLILLPRLIDLLDEEHAEESERIFYKARGETNETIK